MYCVRLTHELVFAGPNRDLMEMLQEDALTSLAA